MDLSGKTIWQQACGDTNRNYADLCLKWGIILNGPGHKGKWPDCELLLRGDGWSSKKISDLRRFCVEMNAGDYVVLRFGTSTAVAFGEIVGDYEWREEFGDVDGWNIEHVRRVRWLWHDAQNPKRFETYGLKQGDTTQKLASTSPVHAWLSSLEPSPHLLNQTLPPFPEANFGSKINLEHISEYLFDHGVASSSIAKLTAEMGELVRIAKWYQRSSMPSEHETVAYLVAPLLRALGWTPQRMAIEWKSMDLALFQQLPRSEDSLVAIVEAKKMDAACLTAIEQAKGYAESKSGCERLIVTDGLRYGIHVRNEAGHFPLHSYLNLTNLRNSYPIYGCKGAKEALLAMAPEWKNAALS